jgi:hypothetical protein
MNIVQLTPSATGFWRFDLADFCRDRNALADSKGFTEGEYS